MISYREEVGRRYYQTLPRSSFQIIEQYEHIFIRCTNIHLAAHFLTLHTKVRLQISAEKPRQWQSSKFRLSLSNITTLNLSNWNSI